MSIVSKREAFLRSYSGKKLLEKYSLYDEGTWEIRGEDPNCDLSGYHSNPLLGYRQGTLIDAIDEAVQMPGWAIWRDGGGYINPIDVKPSRPSIISHDLELNAKITVEVPIGTELRLVMESLTITSAISDVRIKVHEQDVKVSP